MDVNTMTKVQSGLMMNAYQTGAATKTNAGRAAGQERLAVLHRDVALPQPLFVVDRRPSLFLRNRRLLE